ncbi:MAG: 5-(carboxyamino)imidazole ribonucleotide mutase [Magnetococcales bacterium]|nr:5-(carboxyamino)imidazole ribonucleotide mutase [Magnetococcales bacterium]MBF0321558.1 5-(carboxyamino)imidazole ribonucleotide mutase [Magnetococcales bacterium]
MHEHPWVGILMGSDSDWEVMQEAVKTLKKFGVPCEVTVTSAHRTPARTHDYAVSAAGRGLKVLIVGAGAAAHLAGVVASLTPLPVIGIPLSATTLQGMDALLATVQMPGGIPVATMAIGRAGAQNAALLTIRILALSQPELAERLNAYHQEMVTAVEAKEKSLQAKVAALG